MQIPCLLPLLHLQLEGRIVVYWLINNSNSKKEIYVDKKQIMLEL